MRHTHRPRARAHAFTILATAANRNMNGLCTGNQIGHIFVRNLCARWKTNEIQTIFATNLHFSISPRSLHGTSVECIRRAKAIRCPGRILFLLHRKIEPPKAIPMSMFSPSACHSCGPKFLFSQVIMKCNQETRNRTLFRHLG